MTVASIITKALQSVPPRVRFAVLVAYAAAVVAFSIALGFGVDFHAGVANALVIIGGYLGVQSAVNVSEE